MMASLRRFAYFHRLNLSRNPPLSSAVASRTTLDLAPNTLASTSSIRQHCAAKVCFRTSHKSREYSISGSLLPTCKRLHNLTPCQFECIFGRHCHTSASRSDDAVSATSSSDLDIDREVQRYDYEEFDDDFDEVTEEIVERVLPIPTERGKTGAFDIEDLVTLLRHENAMDLCVIECPQESVYVNFMVIVTGKSTRHLKAMASTVQWMFKQRMRKGDRQHVKIEGAKTSDWMAMDLGNIALHLFLEETREMYDLETLWTVGPEHDEKCQEQNSEQEYIAENFFFESDVWHKK